jgi:hypothetical protein
MLSGCATISYNSLDGKWICESLSIVLHENSGMIEGYGEFFTDIGGTDTKVKITGSRDGDYVELNIKMSGGWTEKCKYRLISNYKSEIFNSRTKKTIFYTYDTPCLVSLDKRYTTLCPLFLARPEAIIKEYKYMGFSNDAIAVKFKQALEEKGLTSQNPKEPKQKTSKTNGVNQ